MNTATLPKTIPKIDIADTFEVKGEEFIVLKKEYLDELFLLMKSVFTGEKLLRSSKTRSFDDFLTSLSERRR